MATNAIISSSNLDISKISFGDIRANKAGGKSVPIKYSNQPLQIRLEKSSYPMGVNVKESDNGINYTMSLTLKGCDPYAKDRAGSEAGSLGTLYNFLGDLQTKLLDTAEVNSVKWFGKSRSRSVLEDTMKQFISPSVEKVNGEWVPSGKYPPSLRMKVPVYDGKVSMDVTDSNGKPVMVDTDNITQVFAKRVEASIVVTPAVYVSGNGWGVTWRISYARVAPPQRVTAADVFKDEIEQEIAQPRVADYGTGTLQAEAEEEEEEQHQEEEVTVPFVAAPEPAPAPAPAKNRRRVAVA
jgi:hypothetical protein